MQTACHCQKISLRCISGGRNLMWSERMEMCVVGTLVWWVVCIWDNWHWLVRFGAVADKPGTCCLYTTHIPVVRSKRPDPCCIVRWNTTNCVSVTKMLNTGGELLSALAVRYDNSHVVSINGCSLTRSFNVLTVYASGFTEYVMLMLTLGAVD